VSRTAQQQVSFADWELTRQGLRLDPLLQAISDFLDDQKDIIEQVRCDLTRGLKNAETGRPGLTPQQILRSLVLMRIKSRAPARYEWSCAMQQRLRIPQTPSLDERLIRDSRNLRKQAEGMPAGVARDDLLRKACQAETRVSTVLERDELATVRQRDWLVEGAGPTQDGT
jgi:hypothetical protein